MPAPERERRAWCCTVCPLAGVRQVVLGFDAPFVLGRLFPPCSPTLVLHALEGSSCLRSSGQDRCPQFFVEGSVMGNGSIHGKDSHRVDKPPKGAHVIGESGKVERYDEADEKEIESAKEAEKKVEAKQP
jgi:hypothetical protein